MRIPTRASHRSVHTPSTAVHRPSGGELRAVCGVLPETCVRAVRPLLCSRFRGAARPLSQSFRVLPSLPRRTFHALVPDADLPHAWTRIRAEMRRAVNDSTWQLWLEALQAQRLEGGILVIEAPAESRAWIESSFARLLAACTIAVLGSGSRVQIVAAARRPAAREGAARDSGRRRSTPASRSTSSSSATPTGSRTPPRWRSPRCPGSPTTRCSSAGRPGSARRTCCTRSPTTSAATATG